MRPLLIAAAVLCIGATTAQAEADHAAIAKASLTQVIRPGYAALAEPRVLSREKSRPYASSNRPPR